MKGSIWLIFFVHVDAINLIFFNQMMMMLLLLMMMKLTHYSFEVNHFVLSFHILIPFKTFLIVFPIKSRRSVKVSLSQNSKGQKCFHLGHIIEQINLKYLFYKTNMNEDIFKIVLFHFYGSH